MRNCDTIVIAPSAHGMHALKARKPKEFLLNMRKHCDTTQTLKLNHNDLQKISLELEQLKQDYQEIFEFSPLGYFNLDENNCIIRVNLTGASLLGTTRNQLISQKFLQFVHKEYQSAFETHCKLVYTTKIKQVCQFKLVRKDGSFFYAHLESIVISNKPEEGLQLQISIRDMTDYCRMEEALRAAEEKFRCIVETTKEWIWVINLQGRYLYSNSSVESILGYSLEDISYRNRLLLIHKEDRQRFIKMLPALMKTKQGWHDLVLRWRHKDGSYRYLESNALPILDSRGKLTGFRGSDHDVTLRKETEAQAHEHQQVLHQAAKWSSLGELASALAHELAQPLTAINNYIAGCIKMLKPNSKLSHLLLPGLQKAGQQAERAGSIIHRMKDFARQGKLHCEKVSITEIIEEAVQLIKKEFPQLKTKIYYEPEVFPLYVNVDKIQIEQVLINLLRNSIEAMENANTIKSQLLIRSLQSAPNQVTVSIIDNGPGFSHENAVKMFEACFTTKTTGIGMGLAICRTIIEAHDGQLTAQSYPGKGGACFQFTLPIIREYND